MRLSRLMSGESFNIDKTVFCTVALGKPSNISAVTASSVMALSVLLNIPEVSAPPPFTILSFSSRISLWALLTPIPFMDLILAISSAIIAFRISSDDRYYSIILAVASPIPDTPIRSLNSSLSSLVLNP